MRFSVLLPSVLCFGLLAAPVAYAQTGQHTMFVSASGDNEQEISGGVRKLLGVKCVSVAGAAAAFLKTFSTAPTMGTTPATDQFPIPAASSTQGAGIVVTLPWGDLYPHGIWIALTGGIATTDDTSVAANNFTCTVYWQ